MSASTKPQYIFKMRLKGTALKGLFNFKKSVLSNGIMRWHISPTNVRCSEINPEGRILINYTIDGKNLVEYKYSIPEPIYSTVFEIQEFSTPVSTMKISDTLKVFITNTNPSILHVHIVDRDNNIKRKKIQTQIKQEVVINQSPDIYLATPVNLEPETFHSFMRLSQNIAKTNDMRITITIQAPDFISFSRDGEESQTHGSYKKKKPAYTGEFNINELKHILKLTPCTTILNIYQPTSNVDIAPLFVRGNIKNVGEFEVYIHRCDVEPIKENEI